MDLTPEEIQELNTKLKAAADECENGDAEGPHAVADKTMCELLQRLGLDVAAKHYRQMCENAWYA